MPQSKTSHQFRKDMDSQLRPVLARYLKPISNHNVFLLCYQPLKTATGFRLETLIRCSTGLSIAYCFSHSLSKSRGSYIWSVLVCVFVYLLFFPPDFLGGLFVSSDRPTQNQEMHSTLNDKKKGDGLSFKNLWTSSSPEVCKTLTFLYYFLFYFIFSKE